MGEIKNLTDKARLAGYEEGVAATLKSAFLLFVTYMLGVGSGVLIAWTMVR